jgi:diaminohydroxyphosphoribosylaminopyrimidine deaminase/5-amino-6-(5-phosphoribosylamino)uracil reductase
VVLDSRLRTPPGARTLSRPGRVLVITATPDADARSRLEAAGAEVCSLPAGPGGVRLDAVLEALAEREINEVHVEAGATLAGALMTEGLVDELVLYTAPVLLGDTARPMLHLPGIERMHERIELELTEVTPIGEDLRLTARPRLRG